MSVYKMVRLAEVMQISSERIEPRDFADHSFNYIGLENIESNTGRAISDGHTRGSDIQSTKNVFRAGQILYGKLRPYLNKVHLAEADGICSTDIFVLTCDRSRILPALAAYYLRSERTLSTVKNLMVGANLPRVDAKGFLEMTLPLPPLPEQKRIVQLLDEAEALRRLRDHADHRFQALVPSLFVELFGDAVGNPRQWPLVALGDVCAEPPNYGTMIPATPEGGEWLCLRVANIQNGVLTLEDRRYVDLPPSLVARHAVRDGDLLLARAIGSLDHLGKCVIARPTSAKWAFDSHLLRVRLIPERAKPDWLRALLITQEGRMLFINQARQSAVQFNINSREFASIRVPLPPTSLQDEFAARVAEIHEMVSAQDASRQRLKNLFESLLSRAFEGEL